MNLSISLGDLSGIQRGLRDAPAFTREVLEAAMTEATQLVEREVIENIPRASTGLTAKSITRDVMSTPAGVLGVVGSSQPSALFLELGTRPHMPPIDALVPWVRAVLGIRDPKEAKSVAFLVGRKIAREGTKPQRPFERAVTSTETQVIAMFEDAAQRIVRHLAGGPT
ncbi:hypothetical protein G7047_19265 [Diaphorobacter sp. HDW4A]|uniref:HK97 gp10 family phage protein n=1 Tax=Diaphorobacter sp. HDW4A TaxID=2714924 RepID=UPI00140BCF0A|nr:HK97 gp10 family phage protein [Diaphorobacter sp. HDW4A]QIL81817.1 hypothetical protein G7047_19265 [Diaphorobacter sp. HDW4A]